MTDLFLSYSRDDTLAMSILRDNLKALGFNLWIDIEHLMPGTPEWELAIEKTLKNVDGMLLLLSPRAKESTWVNIEIRLAQLHEKPIFPVLLSGDETNAIPIRLLGTQYADMRGRSQPTDGFHDLVKGLVTQFALDLPDYEFTTDSPTDIPRIHVVKNIHQGNVLNITGDVVVQRDFVAGDQNISGGGEAQHTASVKPEQTFPPTELYEEASAPSSTRPGWILPAAIGVGVLAALFALGAALGMFKDRPPVDVVEGTTETSSSVIVPTETTRAITPTATLSAGEPARELALAGVRGNDEWMPYTEMINGVEMALVPAGCFVMGSEDGQQDESPIHEVCFEDPFWIDVTEVTNEQYGSEGFFNGADRPREFISWADSLAHCESRGARLPTEAEWEYAARGPDSLVYPWGNIPSTDLVITESDAIYGDVETAPVGSRPGGASWVGALDMIGNVWEWTNDVYSEDYYATLSDGVVNPQGPSTGSNRALRGGSWNSPLSALSGSDREENYPEIRAYNYGFRCVRTYQP